MRLWLNNILLIGTLIAGSLLAAPAMAQDDPVTAAPAAGRNDTPHMLALEGCDFQIEFPGEPATARRCDPEDPELCSRIITYTRVIGLDATMNFNVTCNPLEEGGFERYTGEVMKATLDAMVGSGNLEDSRTDHVDFGPYKQAIIIGSSKINDRDSIYTAQIWISKSSLFTVEAELVGFAGDELDQTFADIVASVGPNDALRAQAQDKNTPADDAKEAEQNAEKDTGKKAE